MSQVTQEKLKAQKGIAGRLKVMTLLLGVGLFAAGIFLTYRAFLFRELEDPSWFLILFTWAVGLCCFYVLYCFWGVCTQIGADNSFSIENEMAFRRMGYCGLAIAAIMGARLIATALLITSGSMDGHIPHQVRLLYDAAELCFGGVFYVICAALSKLIHNAYELKADNDLTI